MTGLLLRTALWTSAIIACGLYFTNEAVIPALNEKAAAAKIIPDAPLPEPVKTPARVQAGDRPAPSAGTLAMVKKYERPARQATRREMPPGITGIPQLKAGKGGWFAQVEFRAGEVEKEPAQAGARRAVRYGAEAENAVILPPAALGKKVEVSGARPVSAAAAAKYAGVDREAEKLRGELRRKAEAELERGRRLLREKLILGVIILAVSAILTLLLSRAISAWRSIHRPEGTHWTLK